MKYLNKLFFALIMLMGLTSYTQNNVKKWAIAFGVNAIDTRTSAGGGTSWLDNHFSQPFKVKENWNILPSISYISVYRYIGSDLSVGLQGTANSLAKYVKFVPTTDTYMVSSGNEDLIYYGVDASLKYSFATLIHSRIIDPSLHIGLGYDFLGSSRFATANAGAGLTFWFTESIGLLLETSYKKSFGEREDANGAPDAPSYFQHVAGLTFRFGGKDTDRDGVPDMKDDCPNVPGLKKFKGCPDTDKDGIPDKDDDCPTQFGLAFANGCPDKDGDGIIDKDDKCPTIFGLASTDGCPDKDGDGIADKDDKCPTIFGLASANGCPDKDGDGVADKYDKCPNLPGPISNKGCPEKVPERLSGLNIKTGNDSFFDIGKATLKKDNTAILTLFANDLKELLKSYPDAKFIVGGHTDNTGSDIINNKLSKERADVVMQALIEKGISPDNLVAKGFGSSQPIATNKTAKGRAENRRTEIKYLDPTEESKLLDSKENKGK